MSVQSVRDFLSRNAPDLEIIEMPGSTATVSDAAEAHGVEPGQIAKTLSFKVNDEVILVLVAGDARVDNRKFKERFGGKAKMLSAEEVVRWTSHPVGGVCPFGLPQKLRTFMDVTLAAFDEVIPAAGGTSAALRVRPRRLSELVDAEWVDVAEDRQAPAC